MKPLPEPVQASFPCEAGTVRERPWWYKSRHGISGADCLRRSDDPHTTVPTVEDAAAHDAANPLPHPGFRAGQVWAHKSGESVTILRAISTRVWASDMPGGEPPFTFAQAYPYLMADPACPWLAPWSPAEEKP
jgi:hypothetical protein